MGAPARLATRICCSAAVAGRTPARASAIACPPTSAHAISLTPARTSGLPPQRRHRNVHHVALHRGEQREQLVALAQAHVMTAHRIAEDRDHPVELALADVMSRVHLPDG